MSRCLPQLKVKHVWRDHFLVTPVPIFLSDKVDQGVVYTSAVRKEEAAPRAEGIEEEKLLIATNQTVVPLCCLLKQSFVVLQLGLVRKSNSVNSLKGWILRISKPVGRACFADHERLDSCRVWYVWPSAQVDERSVTIRRYCRPFLHPLNELHFEPVVAEHLLRLLLCELHALKFSLRFRYLVDPVLQVLEVVFMDRLCFPEIDVVVESILKRWTDAELALILVLHGLAQHMRRGVPEHRLSLVGLKVANFQRAVPLERPFQVPHGVVDESNEGIACQSLRD
mmetsp:Transcript_3968/g.11899  ORF Transcript_3968/g.11899 Transcript_3968/m.11899 type:complete len:282 (-) Transcript_3968:417-1262(-)